MQTSKPTLPHIEEIEYSLVSAAMQSREAFSDSLEIVPHEDRFHSHACKVLWQVMRTMYGSGEPWDLQLLAAKLQTAGKLADTGGYAKLAELYTYSATTANATHYAKRVHALWLLRSMVHLGNDLSRSASETTGEADDIRGEFEKKIFALGQSSDIGKPITSKELALQVLSRLEQIENGEKIGYATGYPDIDKTFNGFSPKSVTLLAGRPGGGKSKLAVNIMTNLAHQGVSSVFYSLEMSNVEIGLRIASALAEVDSYLVLHNKLSHEQATDISNAISRLANLPIHWQDKPGLKPSELLSSLRKMKRQYGIKMACIDHILLMRSESSQGRSRNDEVGEISRFVKLAAKEVDIPILALCQMNRGVEHRGDAAPRLSDLRDSGNLEQDADNVLFLHKPSDDESAIVDLYIAKQRNGPLGKLSLYDRKGCFKFENYGGQLQ